MGRGAASLQLTDAAPDHKRQHHALPRLTQLIPLLRHSNRSPLHHSPTGVAVGAALNTGLLHRLRGAPSQERNAILADVNTDFAMLSAFSGQGKHGLRLADLAASITFRSIRRRLPALSGELAVTNGSFHRDVKAQINMERIVDDALVAAYVAVDDTLWAKSSGVTSTVCLLRRGKLVVGACGLPSVMLVSRKSGRHTIRLITGRAMHASNASGVYEAMLAQLASDDGDRTVAGSAAGEDDITSATTEGPPSAWAAPHLEARYSLPGIGGLACASISSGDGGLPSSASTTSTSSSASGCASGSSSGDGSTVAGACLVPTIRTFELSQRHTHVIVSTMRLWSGDSGVGPQCLGDVFANGDDGCVISLAERLMRVAFGHGGPTHDCSILVSRLR